MAEEKPEKKPASSGPKKNERGFYELKPSGPGKRPTQICVGAKTYKGDYVKIVGHDENGKPITEFIPSKTKFVPESVFKKLPESQHKLFV